MPPSIRPAPPTRRTLLKLTGAQALLGSGWGAGIAAGWPAPAAALDAPATDALLKARLAEQGVGLLAVQVDGKAIALNAQGLARVEPPVPLRDDALFEIGSITKTFTALLLADAVVRKQLALTDAVEDALPGGVRLRDVAGEPIRWIDLATQRSGLPRLPGNMAPRRPNDPYDDYREADLLAWLRGFRPTLARGAQYGYSNLGFGLLGYALGRALGSDYPRALADRVLRPLGLTDAHLALPGTQFDRLPDGHDAQRGPVEHWHLDMLAGAGALVMSGAMLGRYAQAAIGAIETPLLEAFMLTQQEHAPGPAPSNPIGLAWLLAGLNGRRVMNHDGGTFGFSSSLWLDPQRGRAAAVLANAFVGVNDLALHLLDESIPPKDFAQTRQPAIPLTPEQLAPLPGVYALNASFRLAVTLRAGELWAQATGQPPFQLFASAPRRFFARVTPLQVEFAPEPGVPTGLDILQSGQVVHMTRE